LRVGIEGGAGVLKAHVGVDTDVDVVCSCLVCLE